MYRILLLLLPFWLFSAPLKIISLKELNNGVQVNFNQQIKQSNFSKNAIKDGIYYDIKAELTTKRQTFEINKNAVTIAQNTKAITRIVIKSKNLESLQFKINKNNLQLLFQGDKNKNDDKQTTQNDKNNTSGKNQDSNIVNLFSSIDLNAKPNNQNNPKIPPNEPNPSDSRIPLDSTNSTNSINSTTATNLATTTNTAKIIVLDPGHGGKDCGAQVSKVCEKIITLNIAKLAKKSLEERGYKVFITRNNDKYISLTDRTKFANDKNADIFISIHANSLDKKSKNYATTNGIETYFLSTARSERARKVAEIENKDDIEVMNYFSKISFLNSINSHRLLASNKLAIDIQIGMLVNTRKIHAKTTDGGVREGPFWVLAGALMPSILVEVGYMTNKGELKRLQTKDYQQSMAVGIADGIDSYFAKNF